ncbi:MAG: DUF5606 domain-containing protein [Bacteroidetes bacterium]|nr:DUF5606 domain-containing protein [Bacteroidota bacterium]
MELKDIAAVSGKSGLFKIISPTRTGFLLESMDESKAKLAVPANQKISVLEEISIYVNTAEGTTPLKDVLVAVHKKFGDALPITHDADPKDLRNFMMQVLPEYDESRVYNSDIKKLIRWYLVISKQAPEILTAG